MPARRFFAMLEVARELQEEERCRYLFELCDVQAIAIANEKYIEGLKKHYLARAYPGARLATSPVHDAASEQTGKLIANLFGGR